jgi:hypothetical protein
VAAIDALIGLFRSSCPLRTLEAAGGKNSQLKLDILPLLAVLCTNNSLTSLDISGHLIGNKGVTGLGKALQTNSALTKLKWDGNGTTLPGFAYFRIGMKANHHLVSMPMPFADIFLAMKVTNWEGQSPNEKIVQVIREIEGYLQRNLLRNRSSSSSSSSIRRHTVSLHPAKSTITYKDFEQWATLYENEEPDAQLGDGQHTNQNHNSFDEPSIYE